jgi:hypothetical protein
MEKIMSKTNESSKLGRAPQVRELRGNELGGVSGGYVYDATYVVGVVAAQTDGAFGADTSCEWMNRIACCQPDTRLTQGVRFRSHEGVL